MAFWQVFRSKQDGGMRQERPSNWKRKNKSAKHAAAKRVSERLRKRGIKTRIKKVDKAAPPSLQQRALKQAKMLIGVMEQGGNNMGPKVSEIIRENGGTGPEPWCGDFVAYCYRAAGSKAVTRAWAAVRFLGNVAGMKNVGVREMAPGDIVVFAFDHTGILESYASGDGRVATAELATHIKTIEGNTGASGAVSDSSTGGDGVYRKIRHISLADRGVKVLR